MRKNIYMLSFCLLKAVIGQADGNVVWHSIDRKAMAEDMDVLGKKFQQMQQYEVTITDASYADYTTDKYHEKSVGYFKRNGMSFHNYILGIHTIQDNKQRLVIDSARKLMIIADPTISMDSILPMQAYSMLYRICTDIKKATEGGMTMYKMDFREGYPLASYEITLDKDGLPQKIEMFYAKKVKLKEQVSKPRMEIIFSNWTMKVTDEASAFNVKKYVTKVEKKYMINKEFSASYDLLDERVLTLTSKN